MKNGKKMKLTPVDLCENQTVPLSEELVSRFSETTMVQVRFKKETRTFSLWAHFVKHIEDGIVCKTPLTLRDRPLEQNQHFFVKVNQIFGISTE